MLVEICADGLGAARDAVRAGADRIELCEDLSCGGITPSHEVLDEAASLGVPVNVLIRPRGGDFVYNYAEIRSILFNIAYCGNVGVNGVVIGALTPDGRVDVPLCRDFIDLARSYGLSVTFHRAIDRTADIMEALDDVLSLGVDRILTSGGADSAPEGAAVIRRMVEMVAGRAVILAGAGITPENAVDLVNATGVTEIHGSRTTIINAIKKK
ncbi:MAG: copper homeostasis protein CutC [Bacteroidota bacterium]|nr:copper homeostasis protein CutC [Bacteroidota bacterium]